MSRRLTNLLASLVVAAVGSAGLHFYLSKAAPGEAARGLDTESPPQVSVSYQGIAPRRALRLTAQEGHEETARFTLWRKVQSSTGTGKGEVSAGLAAAEHGGMDLKQVGVALGAEDGEREGSFTIELEVDSADAETLTVKWRVRRAEVLGAAEAEWTTAVAAAKHLRGTTVIERSGYPLSASMQGAPRRNALGMELATVIRRWMAEPAPVFPRDPVGHGAIWTVTRDLTDSGVSTRHTARVEVTGLRGDAVTLTERHSASLTGSDIQLGQHFAMLEPSARAVSVAGDSGWSVSLDSLVATGDAGATADVQLGFALGIAEVLMDSATETQLVIDRP